MTLRQVNISTRNSMQVNSLPIPCLSVPHAHDPLMSFVKRAHSLPFSIGNMILGGGTNICKDEPLISVAWRYVDGKKQ